jgi:hypothetical protein
MAVLWFIHADAMYGFPAYELPVSDIIRNWEARLISSFFAA